MLTRNTKLKSSFLKDNVVELLLISELHVMFAMLLFFYLVKVSLYYINSKISYCNGKTNARFLCKESFKRF